MVCRRDEASRCVESSCLLQRLSKATTSQLLVLTAAVQVFNLSSRLKELADIATVLMVHSVDRDQAVKICGMSTW